MGGDSSLLKVFGTVLREHRRQRGMSQEALALESDLDRTFISMLERGLRQPSLTTLFSLAAALNTQPSKLVAQTERQSNRR
jgi:transcriptional regulator with XRE-family HTH domain